MALPILDGNQSATTLSTILTGGAHIPAHTVVSLGSQAISDITSAVSGVSLSISGTQTVTGSVSILNFPASQSVTFGATTGFVSIVGTPAVTFTAVTIPQVNKVVDSVATDGVLDATTNFIKIGGHQSGSNQTAHIVHVSNGGAMSVDATDSVVSISNFPATQAVSGTVTVGNFPSTQTIAGTVTANVGSILDPDNTFQAAVENGIGGSKVGYSIAQVGDGPPNNAIQLGFSDGNGNFLVPTITSGFPISGTVTANLSTSDYSEIENIRIATDSIEAKLTNPLPISGTVTVGNSVTIGSLPAISGTVTANNSVLSNVLDYDGNNYFLKIGGRTAVGKTDYPINVSGTVTIGSLPAISGTVTASSVQGTSVTTSNFTSTTASTTLASANASRRGLTVFNEGAGNLHICAGATATTVAYQVRLSAGDYWECPAIQTSLTHSAQFASSGTARVVEIL